MGRAFWTAEERDSAVAAGSPSPKEPIKSGCKTRKTIKKINTRRE
jgi:hypothetical protein